MTRLTYSITLFILFLPLAFGDNSPRQPRGIYAVLSAAIPPRTGYMPNIGQHPDFNALLDNPAVSGLFINMRWITFEPKKGQFDFTLLDEAFKAAAAKHKTVQLALLPGFGAPRWLLDELPSCEPWLASAQTNPASCGKALFEIPEGAGKGDALELPLPWNSKYKNAWHDALVEVAKRFGQNPAFASIAIAGPTAVSEEIILPREGPGETEKWAKLLAGFYSDPSYHRSNKAFIEEWKVAVVDYGRIFSGITIALTRAPGLPFNPRVPQGGQIATTEIAAYFANTSLGSNGKATQSNGIKAWKPLTMSRPLEMSSDPSLHPRVLAGGMFGTGFARAPAKQGCPRKNENAPICRNITPEQALFNSLGVFFAGTPFGHFYGARDGSAPVQYLDIYSQDILYANDHPEAQAILLEASKRISLH